MAGDATNSNGTVPTSTASTNDFTVKAGLAQMLKGGVIMDVVDATQVRTWLLLFGVRVDNT